MAVWLSYPFLRDSATLVETPESFALCFRGDEGHADYIEALLTDALIWTVDALFADPFPLPPLASPAPDADTNALTIPGGI